MRRAVLRGGAAFDRGRVRGRVAAPPRVPRGYSIRVVRQDGGTDRATGRTGRATGRGTRRAAAAEPDVPSLRSRKRESAPVVKREAKKVKREAQLSDAGKYPLRRLNSAGAGSRPRPGHVDSPRRARRRAGSAAASASGGSRSPTRSAARRATRPSSSPRPSTCGPRGRRRANTRVAVVAPGGGRVAPRHRRGAVADASRRRRRDPRTQVPRQEDLQDRRPRLGAVRLPRGDANEPRRRRGRDADIPWETSRGHAAAATRT